MTYDEAIQCALGYAWGAEDHSTVKTEAPTEAPGSLTFAETFAAAWDAFNRGDRYHMTSVTDGYRYWQDSKGQSIFADGELVRTRMMAA